MNERQIIVRQRIAAVFHSLAVVATDLYYELTELDHPEARRACTAFKVVALQAQHARQVWHEYAAKGQE